jgi:hypothetical protein
MAARRRSRFLTVAQQATCQSAAPDNNRILTCGTVQSKAEAIRLKVFSVRESDSLSAAWGLLIGRGQEMSERDAVRDADGR